MKMPLTSTLLSLTLLSSAAMADDLTAECLEVTDDEFSMSLSDLGFGEGLWEATLTNTCDSEFDVLIDLKLLDSSGGTVTSYMVVAVVPPNSSNQVEKDMHLTSSAVDRIDTVDYELSGREQPY